MLGGRLVLNPHQMGKPDQQWQRQAKVIANRINNNIVLDICGKKTRIHQFQLFWLDRFWDFNEFYSANAGVIVKLV